MAETQTQSKRQREEETHELEELEALGETTLNTTNKRQKYSMNDILSFLDSSEDEEPSQDLSSLITTLQQELSSSEPDPDNQATSSSEQEDDRENVMRHLLEASDDELGIPNINDTSFAGADGVDFDEARLSDQGLWELEDEAAFYYTLMQSELCM